MGMWKYQRECVSENSAVLCGCSYVYADWPIYLCVHVCWRWIKIMDYVEHVWSTTKTLSVGFAVVFNCVCCCYFTFCVYACLLLCAHQVKVNSAMTWLLSVGFSLNHQSDSSCCLLVVMTPEHLTYRALQLWIGTCACLLMPVFSGVDL